MVALPKSIRAVLVGREASMKAIEYALKESREVFVTAQKSATVENPTSADLFTFGTRASILQVGRLQNNTLKILVEGISRSQVENFIDAENFLCVRATDVPSKPIRSKVEAKALARNVQALFKEYAQHNDKITADTLAAVEGLDDDLDYLLDTVATQLNIEMKDQQRLLEMTSVKQRTLKLAALLKDELEIAKTEQSIRDRVQSQVEKHQKDYYLTEQMRAIQRELGRDDFQQEVSKLREKAKKAKMSAEANEKVEHECARLEQMQPTSPESSVSRNYIEWLLSLPWYKQTKDTVTLEKAAALLDASHARMKKAKERIIEFLAAKKFAKDKLKKSPIICLAGPPGVGKTSLAQSIAEALGRKMVRISLGGVRDEAEIRGHRRTYIGALPGKIAQAMKRAGVINPVIVLDEIDKMAMDFRGDPASALLEVLDPEQNKTFNDHFLEVDYDLSQVMFVTTANNVDAIPYALCDRMEIIHLSGYTTEEKIIIARNFTIPKLFKEHGLKANQIEISDEIVEYLIDDYTKEAGVRYLEQVLAKLLRKSIQVLLQEKEKKVVITREIISEWLGHPRYRTQKKELKSMVGVATGLAWTEIGGDVLEIEISVLKGKGTLMLTGQLGEVMQESAQAALSYVRSQSDQLDIAEEYFTDYDIHLHLPEGGIPKDGPSAGITIATALTSALTGRAIVPGIAFTGEVTLRGRVLPVGGIKEKLLAAVRFGIQRVLLPKEIEPDVLEVQKEATLKLDIVYVEHMNEVLELALEKEPQITMLKKSDEKKKAERKKAATEKAAEKAATKKAAGKSDKKKSKK